MTRNHAVQPLSKSPPLSALAAFEAAARHRSFTKAAEELLLTQSAISRHIRNLEDWLQVPLFFRRHRSVVLTPEGDQYSIEIIEAFSRIKTATRKIKEPQVRESLRIHAYSTFAMHWLIPRMKEFQELYPKVDLQLTASVSPINFHNDDIHCAIRTTPGDWPGDVRADRLFDSDLVAVASPSFCAEARLNEPCDLADVTLLHSLPRASDWIVWLRGVGAAELDIDCGLRFESSVMTYLAAEQGMGVAVAQRFLVEEHFKNGRLKQVFPQKVRSERSYFLLSSPRYVGYEVLEIFRDWLVKKASCSLTSAPMEQIRPIAHIPRDYTGVS